MILEPRLKILSDHYLFKWSTIDSTSNWFQLCITTTINWTVQKQGLKVYQTDQTVYYAGNFQIVGQYAKQDW